MSKLKEYKMYINGEWVDAENKKTFETLNPENNEPWAVVPEASANRYKQSSATLHKKPLKVNGQNCYLNKELIT